MGGGLRGQRRWSKREREGVSLKPNISQNCLWRRKAWNIYPQGPAPQLARGGPQGCCLPDTLGWIYGVDPGTKMDISMCLKWGPAAYTIPVDLGQQHGPPEVSAT